MDRKFAVVTTFSAKGYEEYGKAFLESCAKHWGDVPLHVYWEGPDHPALTGVVWHDLDRDADRCAFLNTAPDDPKDYRKQAKRFCHKIFALTDPERLKLDVDTWIWLDADVVTKAPVDQTFLETVCPEGFVGSYLGRKDWHHSECGFVSYRGEDGRAFLSALRSLYTSGDIFTYEETHDSYLFDRLREEIGGWWYNISEGVPGMHVWDDCILGTRMKHKKGGLRKAGVSSLPAGYGSMKEVKKSTVAKLGGQNLLIKTKNCVPNEKIQANIHYSSTLNGRWVQKCDLDLDSTVVFVSGGPSVKDSLDLIRELGSRPNHYIVCVKTSHDTLIESGIAPFGCVLLDPRAHVQDFIENPHPAVIYFTASMCHPTTWDRLLQANAKIFGYHAMVGAGEEVVLKQRFPGGAIILGGGCSAAMRGVAVLHALGFRRFEMVGYDASFPEKPDMTIKTDKGESKYLEVDVAGRKFWTDAEKIAQVQDFQKMLEQNPELKIRVHGDGIVAHLWQAKRTILPAFLDLLKSTPASVNIEHDKSEAA